MTLKIDAKFEEKLIFCFKMTRILWHLIWALASLQNLHFHLILLCKVFNVWPKKVQRSYFSLHWRVIQNLKKNWLLVWKMIWGIWQILTRALESLKKFPSNGFLFEHLFFELKRYRGVIFHKTGEGCNIWKGIVLSF